MQDLFQIVFLDQKNFLLQLLGIPLASYHTQRPLHSQRPLTHLRSTGLGSRVEPPTGRGIGLAGLTMAHLASPEGIRKFSLEKIGAKLSLNLAFKAKFH